MVAEAGQLGKRQGHTTCKAPRGSMDSIVDWNEHDLVFVSTAGPPLDGRNLTRRSQTILERAGLPRRRSHDARHTCASLLLAWGVPARVVMETLGHSRIGLTLDTYAHVRWELQRDAVERMGEVLAGARNGPNRIPWRSTTAEQAPGHAENRDFTLGEWSRHSDLDRGPAAYESAR